MVWVVLMGGACGPASLLLHTLFVAVWSSSVLSLAAAAAATLWGTCTTGNSVSGRHTIAWGGGVCASAATAVLLLRLLGMLLQQWLLLLLLGLLLLLLRELLLGLLLLLFLQLIVRCGDDPVVDCMSALLLR